MSAARQVLIMCCEEPSHFGFGSNGAELTVGGIAVLTSQTLNTYDLLKRTVLIVTSDAAQDLEARLARK